MKKNLSVIIPHHNIPCLLRRCIASIPTREDFEIIVVDDKSSPCVVDFDELQKLEGNNCKLYLTKEGRGAGYARNVGLSHAKGEWVLFADSDDFFVENLQNVLNQYIDSDADMIMFKALSVNSDTLEPTQRNENINMRIDDCLAGKMTAKEASIRVQSPWCRMIKRSFIEKHKIRFEEVMACNDTMFTTKATCLANKIEVSPVPLYVVTEREGSLWASRKTNPENYLMRIKQQILRNNYVRQFGFQALPIIGYVIKAQKISWRTFFRALYLAVSEKALFQGFRYYFKKS